MEPGPIVGTRRMLADRYELGDVIGRGGMGTVHAGRDARLDREVAIKVLRPDMAMQLPVRSRFEAEARLAARLSHPNVVAVFDTGEDGGVPFLVMERLPGTTLADRMARGRLDAEEGRRVAVQILEALGAAHAAGLLHRDVKPGNVLDATPDHWKVGDFGIAKSLEAADASLTSTGLIMGTPAYCAPERLAGGVATTASDLYSVGVVLYEALSGDRPFPAGQPVSSLVKDPPLPLRERVPDLPEALCAVVDRSLAPDPADRFVGAADMAHALVAVRGDTTHWRSPAQARRVVAPTEMIGPAATQVIHYQDPPPSADDEPAYAMPWPGLSGGRRVKLLAAAAVTGGALVVAGAIALSGGSRPGRTTPSASSPTAATAAPAAPTGATAAPAATPGGSPIPPPLDNALNRLQRAVQP